MVPIIFLKPNEKGKVVKLSGGKKFFEKMNSLGIYNGVVIEVISKFNNGPVIIKIGDSRLAIGHNMAQKIFVQII